MVSLDTQLGLSRSSHVPEPGRSTTLQEKVRFLRQSFAYPHCPEAVDVRETHMSWVFLTDGHVYKLKKPIRHREIDYATVDSRRRNAEAEVRLNQDLAPGVYLGVTPLTVGGPFRLQLDGDGAPVDYLVHMRRLPEDGDLEHILERGAVTESMIRDVARRFTDFALEAERAPLTPAVYRQRFLDRLAELGEEIAPGLTPGRRWQSDWVVATLQQVIVQDHEALDQRAVEGLIRFGHGDLRPEHVYPGDPPLIIDCLEFDADLRALDPAEELAFLGMECERGGRPEVRGWLFSVYRERADDPVPDRLVDFYMAWRALLRTQVAVWHLREAPGREPARWQSRVRMYLHLAERYCLRIAPPAR